MNGERRGWVRFFKGGAVLKRLADRFAAAAGRCGELASVERLLNEVCRELGFAYFALLHHVSLVDPGQSDILLENYPPAWREHFLANGFGQHDPVHFASRRTSMPFRWCDLGRLVRLDAAQRLVLERSRRFGIGDGFTVPANIFGEPAASCSFAVRRGTELPAHRLACASLIGAMAFDAARRVSGAAARPLRTHLSRREAQCARLVAEGKTDWEVAMILGLSEETVRQYVKRARTGYDVVSRSQLALRGLADGWVELRSRPPQR